MGLQTDEENNGTNKVGLAQGEYGSTSMDFALAGAVVQKGAEIAESNSPTPNLKSWKRRARHVNEIGLNSPNRMTKRGKREAEEQVEHGAKRIMKKLKTGEGNQPLFVEILAEAVKQPRPEP
jgi:hypothetical protein